MIRPLFFLGTFPTAHTHLEQGLAIGNTQQFRTSLEMSIHQEVNCLMIDAHALWLLGMPDQARVRMQQAQSFVALEAHGTILQGWLLVTRGAGEAGLAQLSQGLETLKSTGLGTLWQSQGKRQAAYDLLAPVYGWFTEGFETVDLKDAKALLQEFTG